jgi:predicted GNAT superfamily acetyltransferase
MTIRPLTELAEFEKCVELQREIWGWSDLDIAPMKFFVVATHIGGLALGAFEGSQMVGFALAIPGVRGDMPYWRSHMTGVAEGFRNAGVGARLKLAQRDHALQRGIRLIDWTFDPLESRNAHLNIQKLGAIVRHYEVNHYGVTSAFLQQGLESDRVVAEWWIGEPRIHVEDSVVRRVYIPSDIQILKKQSLKSAQDVQLRVREQFLQNLQDDYFVAAFKRTDEWSEYLFVPGASRVHQAN